MSDRTPRHNGAVGGDGDIDTHWVSRRQFVATGMAISGGTLAGCLGSNGAGPNYGGNDPADLENFRGSGPLVEDRKTPGGTSIKDLPALEGELNLAIGGGEGGVYLDFIDRLQAVYQDFDAETRTDSSSSLANTLIEETKAGTSQSDLFLSVDAGALIAVANADGTVTLPEAVTAPVDDAFKTDRWVGFAGRARSMPYNTDLLSASALPDSVQDIPKTDALSDGVGWAPTYGAFQAFVTAMRLLRGEEATRQWLKDMQDLGVEVYDDEFFVSSGVADGEVSTGFANHYYALRVLNSRSDAPLDLHFTSGDAGALINATGAGIITGTSKEDLARNFVRHLLSAEGQEFFATRAFAYPTVPDVEPVGGLPTIDELNPPDLDLTQLTDLQPTLELLRETDVL